MASAELPTYDVEEFRSLVLTEGRNLYRDMPWRYIDDAYGVLVSEVMLQQTQVSRVMGKWSAWMDAFPTLDALAHADTADVLGAWQGLGYNRRALNLKRACEACVEMYDGMLPLSVELLEQLCGIGPTTAAGIVAFAYDRPAVYIETNVRTVFIHSFFPEKDRVSDRELAPYVRAACPEEDVRGWYYALLDYGAALKAALGKGADPARRSASYTRQSAFTGSHRQKRAEVLRIVLAAPSATAQEIFSQLQEIERMSGRAPVSADEFDAIIRELVAEGFFLAPTGWIG